MRSHRDGCLCCFTHKNFKSYEFSKGSWLNKAFRVIGNLLLKRIVQILILSATTVFLVGGIWGTLLLQQEYQVRVTYCLMKKNGFFILLSFSSLSGFYPQSLRYPNGSILR